MMNIKFIFFLSLFTFPFNAVCSEKKSPAPEIVVIKLPELSPEAIDFFHTAVINEQLESSRIFFEACKRMYGLIAVVLMPVILFDKQPKKNVEGKIIVLGLNAFVVLLAHCLSRQTRYQEAQAFYEKLKSGLDPVERWRRRQLHDELKMYPEYQRTQAFRTISEYPSPNLEIS